MTMICPLFLVCGTMGDQISRRFEDRNAQMRTLLCFVFKQSIASQLSKVVHDEINASPGQSFGAKFFHCAAQVSHGMHRHVRTDEFAFHQAFKIAQQPLVRQMQETEEIICADLTDTADAVGTDKLKDVTNMAFGKERFDLDNASSDSQKAAPSDFWLVQKSASKCSA